MAYIKANHNETEPYMKNLSWTGGRATPEGIVGAETYSYQSSSWIVTIQYPVVPHPTYTVTAKYTSFPPYYQSSPQDLLISWQGNLQNGTLTETAYNFTP